MRTSRCQCCHNKFSPTDLVAGLCINCETLETEEAEFELPVLAISR